MSNDHNYYHQTRDSIYALVSFHTNSTNLPRIMVTQIFVMSYPLEIKAKEITPRAQ